MSSKQTHDSPMDGVRVKISEKYKPPPRINLAMSYAQRLTLNKHLQDSVPRYDFVLENTVTEKLAEWKGARSAMREELKRNLETARAEQEQRLKDRKQAKDDEPQNRPDSASNPDQTYHQSQSMLIPTQAPNAYSNILTPIPSKTCGGSFAHQDKSPFNISDFEEDTSSPFDNMALKSINDIEELAQVLNDRDGAPAMGPYASTYSAVPMVTTDYTYAIPNSTGYLQPVYSRTNGYYYPAETAQTNPPYHSSYSANYNEGRSPQVPAYNSVPDILKSLNAKLDGTHVVDDAKRTVVTRQAAEPSRSSRSSDMVYPKAKTKSDDVDEAFLSLPKTMQDTSRAISSMGFPLSRVARVCKIVGNDQKKIVEHLLVMSELLDLGFAEASVSKALLQTNNDRDKALDILTL